MRALPLALSLGLVLCAAGPAPLGAAEAVPDADEQLLREANVPTDDASLLAYLRQHTGNDTDLQRLEALVRQLGSNVFAEREQASARLTALGLVALPSLRQAKTAKDAEIARRAAQCVDDVLKDPGEGRALAVVRLLVRRGPAGAAEALLRYLPYVVGEELEEEIWFGLDTLAARDGKVLAIVAAALRAAQGLLAGKDKAGIPALRRALEKGGSTELKRRLEELLRAAEPTQPLTEKLRASRAFEVLEQVGTPEARGVCEVVAKNAKNAWLRESAADALKRMGR